MDSSTLIVENSNSFSAIRLC